MDTKVDSQTFADNVVSKIIWHVLIKLKHLFPLEVANDYENDKHLQLKCEKECD